MDEAADAGREERDSRWVGWLLLAPLPLAVAAYGTVHPVPRAALAALAGLVGTFAVFRTPLPRGPSLPALAGVLLASLAWLVSSVCLLPAGPEARALLQPGLAPLIDAALSVADTTRHTLAVSPDRALQGWSFAGGVLALASGAAWVLRTRRRHVRLAATVVGTGCAVAVTGWAHEVLGLETIWDGGTVPTYTRDGFFAPFVSPNHAGALMASALPLALALATRTGRPSRWLAAVGAAVLALGVWTTQSRGALLEATLGTAIFVALAGSRTVRVGVLATLGVSGGIVVGTGLRRTSETLTTLVTPDARAFDTFGERPQTWLDALGLVADAPFVGVGFGGMADAFGPVKSLVNYSTPIHLHNDALQALVEHGVAGGPLWIGAALVPGLFAALRIRGLHRGRRRTLGSAFAGAGTALLLACFYDFPVRIGALAVLIALLLGTLAAFGGRDLAPAARPLLLAGRALTVVNGLAGLVAAGVLALTPAGGSSPWLGPEADLERADAAWKASAEADDPQPLLQASLAGAKAAVAVRPLDASALLRVARVENAMGDADAALATLEVAGRVEPALPWPWVSQARIQRRQGRATEARVAWRRFLSLNLPDNDNAEQYVREALKAEQDPGAVALEIVPPRADRLRDAARYLAERGDAPSADALFERAVDLDARVALAYARFLLQQQEPERAWAMVQRVPDRNCGTVRTGGETLLALDHIAEAVRWYERALEACGADDRAARLGLGRALALQGDPRAIPILERLLDETPQSHGIRRALMEVLRRRARWTELYEHLEALLLAGVATPAETDELLSLVAMGLPE